jgi:hypothetical protein
MIRVLRVFLRGLRLIFAPLPSIAKSMQGIHEELSYIRQLHETELATRNPPIYRITELPNPNNVEISYTDDPPRKKDWNLFGQYGEDD